MNRTAVLAVAAALLSRVAGPAFAANGDAVYRCGSEYTQQRCVEGRVVDVADPVTAARTADAAKTAADARRLAEQMARDRRAAEAALHPARAGSLGPAKVADASSAPARPKRKAKKKGAGLPSDDEFVARSPKTKVAKS